jgi:GDP-D-mannose 3',5'-epimerase
MRLAVTGHRGFIGEHVASRLESAGHDVLRVEGDLRTTTLPEADGYFHFAAKMGGVGFFSQNQFEPILDNALMDARVISHCRAHGIRLFYPSSACAYPVNLMEAGVPLHESLLTAPADPDQMYGVEKYFITRLAAHADFDLRVGILHTIYGEGQAWSGDRVKFPPQICYKFCRPEPIEVWGNGSQTRTFLYIDDAVNMILEIFFAESYRGPVNVSHPAEVSVREVVEILSEFTGRSDYHFNEQKPTGPSRRTVDTSKFCSNYSTRARIDTRAGFVRLYRAIKAQATETSRKR